MQAFGDGFDLYTNLSDPTAGYWETATGNPQSYQAGRLGGQCARLSGANTYFIKTSGANDALHHLVLAVRLNGTLTGTAAQFFLQFTDSATAQCSVVFRQDGAILLTSGSPTGTTLATYTGAVTSGSTWFAFEIEVNISNTAGYMNVRKNGNTVNDFSSATNLNTRVSANNYANKLVCGVSTSSYTFDIDDFLWRSDPTAVQWVGDIRCYTRMPASDVSAQFSKAPNPFPVSFGTAGSTAIATGIARYWSQQAAPCDGQLTSATINLVAGYTGNMKCAIFASGGVNTPTTVLATATVLSNPATGNNTFTFPAPATFTRGTMFFVGFESDTSSGTWNASGSAGLQSTTAYAAFPASSPTIVTSAPALVSSVMFIPSGNYTLVNEAQEDGATSYVYDSNVGDADFYAIAALAGTPASTVCVTTRGFFEKSDAGTRSAAVQLKSGATTVASASTALSTSFGWLWRTDLNDPNTSAAWTAVGVNNAQIGPVVTV